MNRFANISSELTRRLMIAFSVVILVIFFGMIGIKYFENLSWLDSLYFTVTLVTTVGFGDIVPETTAGRVFISIYALVGVGTVLYSLSLLAQSLIQNEVLRAMGLGRGNRKMKKINGHYIVCGAGRVGRGIIERMNRDNIPFIGIESRKEMVQELEQTYGPYFLHADATLEKSLTQAGIERAAGLASCLPEDAKNVYVVLISRDLNENLHIVSRAAEPEAEPKLIRAGANRVVSPIIIGSQSMTRALTKPAIADFMDSIVAETLDLAFDEISLSKGSFYANKRIMDTNIAKELNILIVAIRRHNGEMIFNPSGQTQLLDGDMLIAIGRAESVKQLKDIG